MVDGEPRQHCDTIVISDEILRKVNLEMALFFKFYSFQIIFAVDAVEI